MKKIVLAAFALTALFSANAVAQYSDPNQPRRQHDQRQDQPTVDNRGQAGGQSRTDNQGRMGDQGRMGNEDRHALTSGYRGDGARSDGHGYRHHRHQVCVWRHHRNRCYWRY